MRFHFRKNPSGCRAGRPVLISDRLWILRGTRSHRKELLRRRPGGFRSAKRRRKQNPAGQRALMLRNRHPKLFLTIPRYTQRISDPSSGFPDAASARTHYFCMPKPLLHSTGRVHRAPLKAPEPCTVLPSRKVHWWRWKQPGTAQRVFRRLHKPHQIRLSALLSERKSAVSELHLHHRRADPSENQPQGIGFLPKSWPADWKRFRLDFRETCGLSCCRPSGWSVCFRGRSLLGLPKAARRCGLTAPMGLTRFSAGSELRSRHIHSRGSRQSPPEFCRGGCRR